MPTGKGIPTPQDYSDAIDCTRDCLLQLAQSKPDIMDLNNVEQLRKKNVGFPLGNKWQAATAFREAKRLWRAKR